MKYLLTLFFCLFSVYIQAENYPYQSSILWVTQPDHDNWIYKTGEKANIEVSVFEYGIPLNNVEIEYAFGAEMLDKTNKGVITLKQGKANINIGTSKVPGFIDCEFTLKRGKQKYKHHVKVGFEPEKLLPYTKMPSDFHSFWENELNEQKTNVPYEIKIAPAPEYSTQTIDCYLVKIQCFKKGQYVYGYLSKPKKEGKYPVVLTPPGAGIKPLNPSKYQFYADEGFIKLDIEIHGIRPNLDAATFAEISANFNGGYTNYFLNGLDNPKEYYMKRAYLACIRCIDFLTTLPEWDGKNIIAQGGSQGGALALITTALDKRVTACAAHHPALSDMAGYKAGRAGGYPHMIKKYPSVNTDDKINTMAYYDVVNFAKLINVPVWMTWGYNDNTCPPTTSYCVYNVLNCPKEKLVTPINEHWTSNEVNHTELEWIKTNIK
ncbi:MAG: acetylxylan esterase [Bacteroidales bacterium]|nr:acetylxylan esterase [Bacteroidales bacterium]